ncbi:hypothetical protein lerEdw1_020779 [Lerista edwardsae]|nr:hypothetical protein lerEdw1_020779 [Lerista edwardsae]
MRLPVIKWPSIKWHGPLHGHLGLNADSEVPLVRRAAISVNALGAQPPRGTWESLSSSCHYEASETRFKSTKAWKRRQEAGGGSEQTDPEVGEKVEEGGGGGGEEGGQKLLCGVHRASLALFCTTDETPICHRCVDAPAHAGHSFSSLKNGAEAYKASNQNTGIGAQRQSADRACRKPLERCCQSVWYGGSEADGQSPAKAEGCLGVSPGGKEKLEEALQPLGTRIKELEQREGCQKEKINSMKDVAVSLRANIEAKFSELQQFLSQRKEALLAQVEEDEKKTCTDMEARLLQFQERLRVARELMSQGTTRMAGDDPAAFLLDIKDFLVRLAAEETDEEDTDELPVLCEEFDMGKFKGPPQHTWCRPLCPLFKQGLEPVQLDHRTANPIFSIVDEGTRVLIKRCHYKLFNNPERFQNCKGVLGQTSFFSGKYYWEVEYNDIGQWLAGVATKSVERKSKLPPSFLGDQIWFTVLPKENNISSVDGVSCYRAGVYLDYEGGQLSFYDVAKGSLLGSYKAKFKEAVYPIFLYAGNTNDEGSLTICHTDMEPPLTS